MNYLAHLLLAENTPDSRIGNLLGDFVKGRIDQENSPYSPGIIKGIRTHFKVDAFTDTHEVFKQSKKRIYSSQGRFSGVLIDVFYDHFLAKNWDLFSSEKLETFADNIYIILQKNYYLLPEKLQLILPRIILENWLVSYQKTEGIQQTCQRLGRRIKRPNHFAIAHHDLQQNYPELERDFFSFFPQLVKYVEQNRHTF
ncbi:ACP phosphodiesterase [Cyanothece sp. BG0011]|uniref:acyl carrier protein phosphodiesterase n=1 Tax=Cyanothece sp. BG0011 TaxID=2082950 RepID=UPI000D1DE058|nr:acyl carrier protein phosphodiesterase [Cyanothece sp. BG0011]